mgnify:CR=1 FL=1
MAAACEKNIDSLPIRLMFQDEARFGRMSDPRRCWAPTPCRPVVGLALVREFVYVYVAVSPHDGCLDYWTIPKMNTLNMNQFLSQVHKAHPGEFIVMILDGASSHKGKDLIIYDNIVLVRLPPYSPELNPAELVWNMLRKNEFANRVFDSLEAVVGQLETGLHTLAANKTTVKSLTCWPYINAILNA